MREMYEKYYTARLFFQDDAHFRPDIIDIPGKYDTADEAYRTAEKEYHKYDWVSDITSETCNLWQIQVLPHYKAV